jgi:hypothetical protein
VQLRLPSANILLDNEPEEEDAIDDAMQVLAQEVELVDSSSSSSSSSSADVSSAGNEAFDKLLSSAEEDTPSNFEFIDEEALAEEEPDDNAASSSSSSSAASSRPARRGIKPSTFYGTRPPSSRKRRHVSESNPDAEYDDQ